MDIFYPDFLLSEKEPKLPKTIDTSLKEKGNASANNLVAGRKSKYLCFRIAGFTQQRGSIVQALQSKPIVQIQQREPEFRMMTQFFPSKFLCYERTENPNFYSRSATKPLFEEFSCGIHQA